MEYCGKGDLYRIIQENDLTEEKCKDYLKGIIKGVNFLHKNNFIHRDLKPQNILITDKDKVKIADFGLSRYLSEDQMAQSSCGTPSYTAPVTFPLFNYLGNM